MSDEDSLSELNVAPQRLMPKSQSLTEHHRILNLSAVHHGNTLATIKAHKVRQDNLEEEIDAIKNVRDDIWDLKAEMASHREASKEQANQLNKTLADHGALIGQLSEKLVLLSSGNELKKAVVTGIVTVLVAIVTAYGGYTMGHKPDATYEPHTKAQIQQTAEAVKAFDPDNVKRENR